MYDSFVTLSNDKQNKAKYIAAIPFFVRSIEGKQRCQQCHKLSVAFAFMSWRLSPINQSKLLSHTIEFCFYNFQMFFIKLFPFKWYIGVFVHSLKLIASWCINQQGACCSSIGRTSWCWFPFSYEIFTKISISILLFRNDRNSAMIVRRYCFTISSL